MTIKLMRHFRFTHLAVVLLLILTASNDVQAAPRHRKSPPRHPLKIGAVSRHLLPACISVRIGGGLYYYYAGYFYRPAAAGYVVVTAPVGAVVPVIPQAAVAVTIGGTVYYTYNGTYYLPEAAGYRVVPVPVVSKPTDPPAEGTQQVMVTAELLNVRSGPGMHHEVLFQVGRHTLLSVLSSASGWLYVMSPAGAYGWVMTSYTAAVEPAPKG